MKKITTVLVIMTIFILKLTTVYALDISIDQISILDKSDTTVITSVSSNNLIITPNLVLNNIGDYVTLKVEFKGTGIKKNKIVSVTDNNSNDYINISYKYDETLNYPLYITIEYVKQAFGLVTLDDIYITINLDDGSDSILPAQNPGTGILSHIIVPIILIGISIVSIRHYTKYRNDSTLIILILCLTLIPLTVKAAINQTVTLVLNAKYITVKDIMPKSSSSESEPSSSSSSSKPSITVEEPTNKIGTGEGGAGNCAGNYIGQKYTLTESQKQKIAGMILGEYGNDLNGMKAVASHMANLYEIKKYNNSTCTNNKTFYEYITSKVCSGCCGWYATWDEPATTNANALKAVEDVIIGGNRTLPLYIDEFDLYPGDIIGASSISDSNNYTVGVTKISNVYGGSGTYYCITASSRDANIFFYTSSAEKYRNAMGYSKGF